MTGTLGKHEQVLQVVRETTAEVFSTMLAMSVTETSSSVETGNTTTNAGLMAVVGMSGAVSGSGCLCVSGALACRIASRFLMAEIEEINDDVLDAISELCNMIVGNLKTSLEDQYGPMGLSLPTVVYGKDYRTRNSSLCERINFSFLYQEDGLREEIKIVVCLVTDKLDIHN